MIKLKLSILFFSITISLAFDSCNTRGRNSNYSQDVVGNKLVMELNAEYDKLKSKVDTSFTDHFPFSLDTTTIQLSSAPLNQDTLYKLILINRLHDTGLLEEYSQKGIAIYSGDTPCVFSYQKFESFKKYPSSFRQCFVDKYPIPDFRFLNFFDKSTESYLPTDFQIIVLESMPYINIPDSLVVNNTMLYKKWEKGFSRGVAVSEVKMIIIYWTIIWQ